MCRTWHVSDITTPRSHRVLTGRSLVVELLRGQLRNGPRPRTSLNQLGRPVTCTATRANRGRRSERHRSRGRSGIGISRISYARTVADCAVLEQSESKVFVKVSSLTWSPENCTGHVGPDDWFWRERASSEVSVPGPGGGIGRHQGLERSWMAFRQGRFRRCNKNLESKGI